MHPKEIEDTIKISAVKIGDEYVPADIAFNKILMRNYFLIIDDQKFKFKKIPMLQAILVATYISKAAKNGITMDVLLNKILNQLFEEDDVKTLYYDYFNEERFFLLFFEAIAKYLSNNEDVVILYKNANNFKAINDAKKNYNEEQIIC